MKPRPKVGEKRQVRQPLKIDKLPAAMQERIIMARGRFTSFDQIEAESPTWPEWKDAPTEVARLFPGKRIPATNLWRWYDVRVEQVRKEVLAQAEAARQLAETFKGQELSEWQSAALNALRDQTFTLLQSVDPRNRGEALKALQKLGEIIAELEKSKVRREAVELDKQKIEIARDKLDLMKSKILGLKKDVKKKELSPDQLQQRLDEIYGITA